MPITTTAFKIDLIVPCIGMKLVDQPKQDTYHYEHQQYLKNGISLSFSSQRDTPTRPGAMC